VSDDSEKVNAGLGIYGGFTKETGLDAGIDRFEGFQEPKVDPGGDSLARFVIARIREAELEPRNEVLRVYDQAPAGPMAHRYAKAMRRDMVTFRRIVERYLFARLEMTRAGTDHGSRIKANATLAAWEWSMFIIANRWSDHHEFRAEWRLA
jgi:hypothetical protein